MIVSIKSADYTGAQTTTLAGCTKTVEVIDVGDCPDWQPLH